MVVWIADHFAADGHGGGAELTSQAIMEAAAEEVVRRRSRDLTEADVEQYGGATWIIDNMLGAFAARASYDALYLVFATQRFFKVEYDYNWCQARSPLSHLARTGRPCDCGGLGPLARLYAILQERAEHVFYMSVQQRAVYRQHLGPSMTLRTSVLSSCFSRDTMESIAHLAATPKGRDWLIVTGLDERQDFWRKGSTNGVSLARELGLPFTLVGGLRYEELLSQIARSRGLICLPNNLDPCPRTVIEARLMGRSVILNENVQHKDEPWFNDATPEHVAEYVCGRPAYFWRIVGS